jgi:serine/threonine protein kinase
MAIGYFEPDTKISLVGGGTAVVKEKLGEGGQGVVYRVSVGNEEYALKWYHTGVIREPDKFHKNLANNISKGKPNNSFLWPLFLTERKDGGSFGYVMELRKKNLIELSRFLVVKARFASITAIINACLNITSAFRELRRRGYSYQDLNDSNFFFDPNTGDALICDNDNVAPDGENLGIAGKARYMAPEVVRGDFRPDVDTDQFSLAVILFLILFLNHPLEGQRVNDVDLLDDEEEKRLFGREPLFIYDKDDNRNTPVRAVHSNVIRYWPMYPKLIREQFTKAFSKEAMMRTKGGETPRRLTDAEWRTTFIQLRDMLITCPCGAETFVPPDEEYSNCIHCGIKIPRPSVLKRGKYNVTLFPGKKLYLCHVDPHSDDYETVCGEVVRSPKNEQVWGLKNTSDSMWIVTKTDDTETEVAKGQVAIIVTTKAINFGTGAATISHQS